MATSFNLQHRRQNFEVRIADDGALELLVDHCLRKRREAGERQPQYVWTNVELEWEEHHYIEARFWADQQRLLVTVNRDPILDRVLEGQHG